MIFSKSFGYAIRGVLYVALMQDEKRYVQVEEIASKLAVPRHFMGKILKKLAKEKVLQSIKGPSGGFTLNEHTLKMPLMDLITIIDGVEIFGTCVLRAKECNSSNPCPLHHHMEQIKGRLSSVLSDSTIGDLLDADKPGFIRSISTAVDLGFVDEQRQVQTIY